MGMLKDLAHWVLAWADTPYSTVALFVLSFAESSFFPIPPDTLLIALGLMQPHAALFLALIATIGSVLGGILGFGIGRYGGRPVVLKLFGEQKVSNVERLYKRYDVWAVFFAAFTPIPYKVFSISAGVCDLDLKRFALASLLGRGGRFFLVGGLLTVFGDSIQFYLTNYLEVAIIALSLLLVAGFVSLRFVNRLLLPHKAETEADAPVQSR
jgi:membrane protein YqaA with SNARE-associated domain